MDCYFAIDCCINRKIIVDQTINYGVDHVSLPMSTLSYLPPANVMFLSSTLRCRHKK